MKRFVTTALLAACVCVFGVTAARAQPDRSVPPPVGPAPTLALPPLQTFTLSNGLSVTLVEKHQVPLVQVNLLIEAGRAHEQPGQYGLAALTAALLDEGTPTRSALDLADALDFLGARFAIDTDAHTTTVRLRVPGSRLDDALGLMADVVRQPTFPEAELERLRLERLTELLSRHDDPNAIAEALFGRTLFGEAHPYGRDDLGTEAALRHLAAPDVRRFYAEHYRPDAATLLVVGAVTRDEIAPKLEAAFGGWKPTGADRPTLVEPVFADPAQVAGRTVYLVDKPGAAQSILLLGRLGVPRATADYYALEVLNTILGGSFTSRLNQNLREDKGYTYGARSAFVYGRAAGPFQAGAAVQTDVTGAALAEMMNELRGILAPIPDEEFERAKNYLAMRFPAAFQSVSQVAAQLEDLQRYHLPADYFDQYTTRILAVTAEDVARVAKTYLDPERLAIVVVGDRAAIEAQVRAQNLGPLQLLAIPDVLGTPPDLSASAK